MPRILVVAVALITLHATSTATSVSPKAECDCASIEVFGGRLRIPDGYRLLPEFGEEIRLVRVERDHRKPHGNIYVGQTAKLASMAAREASAKELGATLERQLRGKLQIEIMRHTTRQLLAAGPVTYVSALLYDDKHYVRITDSDADLWTQMLDGCSQCGVE